MKENKLIFLKQTFIIFTALLLFAISGCGLSEPNPPAPKVKYGEFPFEIIYEIDGEEVIYGLFVAPYDMNGIWTNIFLTCIDTLEIKNM